MAEESENVTDETPTGDDAPVAEAAAEETPVAEVVEETPVEEPVAEAEPVAEPETPAAEADEPAPAAAAEGAEVDVEPAADDAPAEAAAPPQPSGPKPKKKRLPRALRPARSKQPRTKPAERKPIVRLEKPEHERGRSQERQGTVVSDAMDKTIVVKVDMIKAHRKYKKVVRRSTKFHVHDAENSAKVGDVVRIIETRPLSKLKRWRLAEIVEAAK
jgi:small subunit ribosomal protein S17